MADILSFIEGTGRLRENLRFKAGTLIEQSIAEWVVERSEVARDKLDEDGRNGSGALGNSVRSDTKDIQKGIVHVLAESYWDFINSGVNGVQNNFGATYSFRNLGVGREMKESFKNFIQERNITELRYINKEGEAITKALKTASDYDSAAYVLARATKKKGIKPTPFMDEAFDDEAIKDLSNRLGQEIVKIIKAPF